MKRIVILGALAGLGLGGMTGCQGKQAAAPSPESLNKLVECQQELTRSKTAAEMCTKQLDTAMASAGSGTEGDGYTIKIEGGSWTLTRVPKSTSAPDLPPAQWQALMAAVEKHMKLSRAGMQQCYQSELKKNQTLQAAVITLQVRVTIGDGGQVAKSNFAPRISQDFDACMGAITKRWTVPDTFAGQTVELPIQLQPTT